MSVDLPDAWREAMAAWVAAGEPGLDSADPVAAYLAWTAENFGLSRDRELELEERWLFHQAPGGVRPGLAVAPAVATRGLQPEEAGEAEEG